MRHALGYILSLSLCLAPAACSKKEDKKEEAKPDESDKDKKSKKKDDGEDGIAFKVKAPAIGDRTEEKKKHDLNVSIEIDVGPKPQSAEITEVETVVEKTEVLAVDGKAVTKAKITYVEFSKKETEGGKPKIKPKSPLDGNTYILALDDGKVVATDGKGGKLAKAEEEALLKKHRNFGKPDPILAGMPEKRIKVGDKVDKLADALREHFKKDDDGKSPLEVTDITVKLASIDKDGDDEVGVFAVELTLGSPKDTKELFSMKMTMKGKIRVRTKDAFATSIDLKGPLTISGTDPKIKVTGKGDAHMQATTTKE